jgi:hypothetical protein
VGDECPLRLYCVAMLQSQRLIQIVCTVPESNNREYRRRQMYMRSSIRSSGSSSHKTLDSKVQQTGYQLAQ